jgi:hypothetical protein
MLSVSFCCDLKTERVGFTIVADEDPSSSVGPGVILVVGTWVYYDVMVTKSVDGVDRGKVAFMPSTKFADETFTASEVAVKVLSTS